MKTININKVKDAIISALKEDIGTGDITSSSLISPTTYCRTKIIFKEAAVVCGLNTIKLVYSYLDRRIVVRLLVKDGKRVRKNTTVATITGPMRGILAGERVALNFIQRLSGIATLTRKFVDAVSNYNVKILDTRKTTPGLRELEKYAVRCGGGVNHRMGLYDAILIKGNHIRCYNTSLAELERKIKKLINRKQKTFVEIEATSISEAIRFSRLPVNAIMLDNMIPSDIRKAVKIIRRKSGGHITIEASGGITLKNVRAVAKTGVDRISIGAITHSVKAIDVSLEVSDIY